MTSVESQPFVDQASVAEGWRSARQQWPGVEVALAEFAARVEAARCSAGHTAEREPPPRWSDLYIACASATGDATAVLAFERAFFGEIDAAAARLGSRGLSAEELRQAVRERLFVAPAGGTPRILEYSGRGALRSWLRIVATRAALNATARVRREVPFEGDALAFVVGTGDDPELSFFRQTYAEKFRCAFGVAFEGLEARERTLLRYAFLEGLTVDAVAELHGVHRATAARWIVKSHQALRDRLTKALAALGVSAKDYASVVRLMQSHLEITLERYLT